MRITIDTSILNKENLSLGEFLMLLMAFHDINYKETINKLVDSHLLAYNVFENGKMILSDNIKALVIRLIMASSDKVMSSNIDFYLLAHKMQDLFPEGCKEGTSYPWKSNIDDAAFNLMLLFYKYDFRFTEQEAIDATKKYVGCFREDRKYMQLLKHFIVKTYKSKANKGEKEFTSLFMTMIENNRNNEKQIESNHEISD